MDLTPNPLLEIIDDPIIIYETKSMHVPFMPKKKHQPKGHERKYKYHK